MKWRISGTRVYRCMVCDAAAQAGRAQAFTAGLALGFTIRKDVTELVMCDEHQALLEQALVDAGAMRQQRLVKGGDG